MKDNKLNRLERLSNIWLVAYRKDIRRFILKVLLVLNMVMFIIAFLDNMPSMILFIFNVFYLYKYMKDQYPESKVKMKDRFSID